MIYILEGIHGAGKSTYAKTLNLPIKNLCLKNIDEIKNELNNNDNVVYDRLFGLFYGDRKTDEEILELNTYLKSLNNVSCIMFISDMDLAWERQKTKEINKLTREKHEKVFSQQKRLLSLMDCFSCINIDSDNKLWQI